MSEHLRPSELTQALEVCIEANVPTVIWGPPGIAKSALVKQLAAKRGVPFVDLRLATQEVGDLTGVPYHDTTTNRTMWGKPSWWLEEDEWILFIDELNRGTRETIQAVFQLVQDRQLHTHYLPKGVRIIAACNPPEGGNIVDSLEDALYTRFCHLQLTSDKDEWLANCGHELHPDVIGYIGKSQEKTLCEFESTWDVKSVVKRTNRTWSFLSKIYEACKTLNTSTKITITLLTGVVGSEAMLFYRDTTENKWTTINDILEGRVSYSQLKQNPSDYTRFCRILPFVINMEEIEPKKGDKNEKQKLEKRQNLEKFLINLITEDHDKTFALLKMINEQTARMFVNKLYANNTQLTKMVNITDTVAKSLLK